MSAEQPLPLLLAREHSLQPDPGQLEGKRVAEFNKAATFWLGPGTAKVPRAQREPRVLAALKDDAAAAAAVASLSDSEREVLSVFRRYGGTVNGTVLRLDLMARGLLRVVETGSPPYVRKGWRSNPVAELAERLALVRPEPGHWGSEDYSGDETQRAFPRYSLHAGLVRHLRPAGPASWAVPSFRGTPVAVTRRSPGEVALDLARVYVALAQRGGVRLNKSGVLGAQALKSLARAVPLGEDSTFVLPDAPALYLEVLHSTGAAHAEGTEACARPEGARRFFALPTARQAHAWARGWLEAHYWQDGAGAVTPPDNPLQAYDAPLTTARQVLAWALSCLAHLGDRWFELKAFLAGLHDLYGNSRYDSPRAGAGWDPGFPEARQRPGWGEGNFLASWYEHEGVWFANALLVTLVELGLVERGLSAPSALPGAGAGHCFRLTGAGRSAFGAPEVPPVPEPAEEKFLVVQPNFDVLAYLDRASAASAAFLGQISEVGAGGAIRTGRLTQGGVYWALEDGVQPTGVVEFLRQHSQSELPANLVRSLSDWFARRETLAVRTGLTVRAFRSPAERDAYLGRHPGSACGTHFAIVQRDESSQRGELVVDHAGGLRRALRADEHGRLSAEGPLDLVQEARLRRLAGRSGSGWQLSAGSLRRALAEGLKPAGVWAWLGDHLAEPLPPLVGQAVEGWLGQHPEQPMELGEAVLLHVPGDELFAAVAGSPRLRPFLAGVVGGNWLLVRRERRAELEAALAELGFAVGAGLTPGGLRGEGKA